MRGREGKGKEGKKRGKRRGAGRVCPQLQLLHRWAPTHTARGWTPFPALEKLKSVIA